MPVGTWSALVVGVVSILNAIIPERLKGLINNTPDDIEGLLSHDPDYKRQPTQIDNDLWLNQLKRPASMMRQLRDLLNVCSGTEHSLCDELWFTVYQEYDDTVIME